MHILMDRSQPKRRVEYFKLLAKLVHADAICGRPLTRLSKLTEEVRMCEYTDTMGLMWDRMCEMKDKRAVLRLLALLDAARIDLAESAPRGCCAGARDRAIDGRVRCTACGRSV